MIPRRAILRGAGLAFGGAALPDAWTRVARAQTASGKDVVIAQGAGITQLDPHFSSDLGAIFNIYDTLVTRRADNRLYPSLATRWKLLEPTTWEFELRTGVRFHTGDPFTAADVRFSIERTYDPKAKTILASVFTTVERIETPDAGRVRFRTWKPDPLLPSRLAYFGGQILPKGYVEEVGADGFNARPVGTGPLRFVERAKGEQLVLDAVPDYWGGRIDPTRVVFRPIPEMSLRVAALLRGEVDISTDIAPDHVDRIEHHPATRVEEVLYPGLHVLVVDSRRPPLGDPLVKQALSLAIDRDAIVRELWRGRGLVPNGPIPREEPFHDPSLPPLAYDPNLARRRLAEAGYRGEPIILESRAGHLANDKPMSEAIVAMWREVGINARMEVIEYAVLAAKVREGTVKGIRWGAPLSTLADPDGMMWRLLGPGGIHGVWRHPRFDELGNAARFSMDERFRRQAYREMTAIFLEHLPWIPVLQPMSLYGVRRRLDWKPNPNAQIELRRFNLRLRGAESVSSPSP
jgi:peptide/nickel transport system substrate-binding protein